MYSCFISKRKDKELGHLFLSMCALCVCVCVVYHSMMMRYGFTFLPERSANHMVRTWFWTLSDIKDVSCG